MSAPAAPDSVPQTAPPPGSRPPWWHPAREALERAGTAASLGLALSGLFWLLAAWPATLSTDALDIWRDVTTRDFSTWHTAGYEAFVFLLSLGGRALWLVALTQTALLMWSLAALLGAVAPGLPLRTRLWCVVALQLLPFVGAMGVTLWKDVPYTALMLLGLSELLRPGLFTGLRWLRALGFLLGATLLRHDGWMTLVVIAGLAAVLARRPAARGGGPAAWLTFWVLLLAALLGPLASWLLGGALHARPAQPYLYAANFFADARYLANKAPDRLRPEDLAVLDRVSTGDSRQGANWCGNVNPFLGGSGFDQEAANQEAARAFPIWLRAARANPGDFAALRLCRVSSLLPAPLGHTPDGAYQTHWGIDQPNFAGLQQRRIVPGLAWVATVWRQAWEYNGALLFWPGLHLTLLLLGVRWLVTTRRQPPSLWLVACFATGRMLLLLLTAPAQDYRYAHFVVLESLVVLLACALRDTPPRTDGPVG